MMDVLEAITKAVLKTIRIMSDIEQAASNVIKYI